MGPRPARSPPILGFRLLTLMALSGFLRATVYVLMAPQFKEVREASKRLSSFQLFFSVVGIQPLLGEGQKTIFLLFRRLRKAKPKER